MLTAMLAAALQAPLIILRCGEASINAELRLVYCEVCRFRSYAVNGLSRLRRARSHQSSINDCNGVPVLMLFHNVEHNSVTLLRNWTRCC